MQLKNRLKKPTLQKYSEIYDNLKGVDLLVYFILRLINYNLFIFVLGLLASLAINILTSLAGYKIENTAFFISFLISNILSFLVTIYFAKFTLRYIEIQDYCKQAAVQFAQTPDDIEEGMTNRAIEKFLENKNYLSHNLLFSIWLSFLLIVSISLSFILVNVF